MKYYSSTEFELNQPRDGDCGYDLKSIVNARLEPFEVQSISTGIYIEIPVGYFGRIEERSSMGSKGVSIRGRILDRIYRGEIKVMLHNLSGTQVTIEKGDKIAQLVIIPYADPRLIKVESVEDLSSTDRGSNGFGSTGK